MRQEAPLNFFRVIPDREVCQVAERKYLVKASEVAENASGLSHPWNPNSEIMGTRLDALVGLCRIGVYDTSDAQSFRPLEIADASDPS